MCGFLEWESPCDLLHVSSTDGLTVQSFFCVEFRLWSSYSKVHVSQLVKVGPLRQIVCLKSAIIAYIMPMIPCVFATMVQLSPLILTNMVGRSY